MKPKLYERTKSLDHDKIKQLFVCIENFECDNFFTNHLGKNQIDQKEIVKGFQYQWFGKFSCTGSSLIANCLKL